MEYNHKEIEKKWQKYWLSNKTFKVDTYHTANKPPFYALDMFPYPSGDGLHVGHPRGYTATDIISRKKRMEGYDVLHPMGWDAFGLPAEQHALKTNNFPGEFTKKNINNFRKQIQSLGLSYDWDRELATTDSNFYKWTQWIFLKLYEKGLAYVTEIPVNWCEELGTVLANEEVINGKSEVGGFPVIRKPMRQWILKITEYADRLLQDLDDLDWPEATKEMQRNWIGKSIGASVNFEINNSDLTFSVFTTRVDTLFGCTYCVLAPENPLVDKITISASKKEVDAYKQQVAIKSDLDRTDNNKEKTGVFTGAYCLHPITKKKLPIWIADYVLATYGTGAVMAVPAHDDRDYEFAKKYNLKIIRVVDGDITNKAFTNDGIHINSQFIDGMNIEEAAVAMTDYLTANNLGAKKVSYRLRDWVFSRQRFWGEPIPIIHKLDGTIVPLSEEDLPLELPLLQEIKPSKTGESPLANASDWLNVTVEGEIGRRETNTMPQWAGSSWYYLRYIDPNNEKELANKELLKRWLPVNLYIGGAEHSVMHLLYARFWHKVLFDLGIVPTSEPFQKLYHQGMIIGSNGEKMSKSRGNVINPDAIVEKYGADTLRLYEMFMGPLESSLPWSETGLEGARRFIDRFYRLFMTDEYKVKIVDINDGDLDKIYHRTVKKVTDDYDKLAFNTAISQMMIFINEAYKAKTIYREYVLGFIKLINPICPHIAEELWQHYTKTDKTISYETWPSYDSKFLVDDKLTIAVQINGKLKATFESEQDVNKDTLENLAKQQVASLIANREIVKIIVVPNKIVNIVIK